MCASESVHVVVAADRMTSQLYFAMIDPSND